MIERQRQSLFGRRPAHRHAPPLESVHILPDRTVPTGPIAADEPTILGFPTEDDPATGEQPDLPQPPSAEVGALPELRLVALPRADPLAGIALVLAGLAAIVSLWLPWRQGSPDTGASLTRDGLAVAGAGLDDLGRTGSWEPPVIVIGGALLLLLGILLFLPARTHRVVGVLALVVSVMVSAAVLVEVGQAGWLADRLGLGLWFAVAVAVLGVLGALKAMLTVPRVTLKHRRAVRQ